VEVDNRWAWDAMLGVQIGISTLSIHAFWDFVCASFFQMGFWSCGDVVFFLLGVPKIRFGIFCIIIYMLGMFVKDKGYMSCGFACIVAVTYMIVGSLFTQRKIMKDVHDFHNYINSICSVGVFSRALVSTVPLVSSIR